MAIETEKKSELAKWNETNEAVVEAIYQGRMELEDVVELDATIREIFLGEEIEDQSSSKV